MNLLGINEAQATDIVGRYLKDVKDINLFLDYYFETIEKENPVGTTYEKLRLVCKKAEIELKKRFEDKEIFLSWLCNKYKNQAFFRVFEGDFEYSYFANYGSDTRIRITQKSSDALICVNGYKQIAYPDGEVLENNVFKQALLEFIFKNQDRIGKNLHLALPAVEAPKVLSLDEKIQIRKKAEQGLYEANKHKLEQLIQSTQAFKSIG